MVSHILPPYYFRIGELKYWAHVNFLFSWFAFSTCPFYRTPGLITMHTWTWWVESFKNIQILYIIFNPYCTVIFGSQLLSLPYFSEIFNLCNIVSNLAEQRSVRVNINHKLYYNIYHMLSIPYKMTEGADIKEKRDERSRGHNSWSDIRSKSYPTNHQPTGSSSSFVYIFIIWIVLYKTKW